MSGNHAKKGGIKLRINLADHRVLSACRRIEEMKTHRLFPERSREGLRFGLSELLTLSLPFSKRCKQAEPSDPHCATRDVRDIRIVG